MSEAFAISTMAARLALAGSALGAWMWYGHEAFKPAPPPPPACLDYNFSCLQPCLACKHLSRPGCSRCATTSRPRCRTDQEATAVKRLPLRWLHIPKCGATLAVSVLSYACSERIPAWHTVGMALRGGRVDVRMAHALGARGRRRGTRCGGQLLLPFDGHEPVSGRDVQLVAMFRRPSQRLISAYLDNLHAWGLAHSERASLKARAPTIAAFARYPGIAGCSAKMLAGYHCAARVDLSDGLVLGTALSVLRSKRFAFIGLTEEWTSSVCLFHRMLPGTPLPMIAEFRQLGHSVNSHRDVAWMPSSNADGVYNESVLDGFVDEIDERVYSEAARIFRRRLDRFLPRPRAPVRTVR